MYLMIVSYSLGNNKNFMGCQYLISTIWTDEHYYISISKANNKKIIQVCCNHSLLIYPIVITIAWMESSYVVKERENSGVLICAKIQNGSLGATVAVPFKMSQSAGNV